MHSWQEKQEEGTRTLRGTRPEKRSIKQSVVLEIDSFEQRLRG